MSKGTETDDVDEFWLFAYGSLIWKPPPHFDQRIPGYVVGYVRRFWQASEDHRGTPQNPGRVVTLIERSYWATLGDNFSEPEDRVWGVAYRIKASKVAEVREYLDIREINGYSIQYTPFYIGDNSLRAPFPCLVYVGLPTNPQFLGFQEPQALAEHILRSRGPSGENTEYLLMLETALDELNPDSEDDHVRDLASRVKRLQSQSTREESRSHNLQPTIESNSIEAEEVERI